MLALRRGVVLAAGDPGGPMQELDVRLGGERRPAIADVALVGAAQVGDDVIVNVAAVDLEPGSGGFDIVHANLTRGLAGSGTPGAHVMKLNYTSLQHAIVPVEATAPAGGPLMLPTEAPVAICSLHGQLAPLAWAFAQAAPGAPRVRADGGRCAAGRAVGDRAAAAPPRPAGRAPDRRPRLWRRG
jgi:hypothetical protein